MKKLDLISSGGGRLHCAVWEPEGNPRAVIQIVHGIAEHFGRYARFAEFLTGYGFLVVAEDHMGHGGSVCEETPAGCISGGWMQLVADMDVLKQAVQCDYPDLPYIFFGHSMGSFMSRTYLYTYPNAGLRAVILSGTAWQPSFVLHFGKRLCALEERRVGRDRPSQRLQNLMFGAYGKQFPDETSPNCWVSSVPEVIEAYDRDPLCGFMPSTGLCLEMLKGIEMNEKKENLEKMPRTVPIFFLSGAKDPVGDNGKGVRQSLTAFQDAGMEDVSCRLYPEGRHEMLNEVNRAAVYFDILHWIESKI